MSYLLLFLMILLLTLMAYIFFKKDILSPTFITCGIYLISVLCSIIGLFYWNDVSELHIKTLFAIILGLVSFGFGELLARYIRKSPLKENDCCSNFEKIQKISMSKFYILIFLLIFSIIYVIFQIKKVCSLYGYSSNFSEVLYFYRKANDLLYGGNANASYDINFIAKQCLKFCCVVCVFFEYMFVKSLLNKEPKKNKFIYLLGMILALFSSLLSTGRSIFMHLIIALLFIFIILYRKKYTDKNSSKKLIRYVLSIGIVSVCLLFVLMPLLGRKTEGSMLDNVSFALGVHIPSFDKKINDDTDYTGTVYYSNSMTFNNLYAFLYKNKIISNYSKYRPVWYRFGNYSSNTYTSLGAYYNDYGFLGVIMLQFIFGFVISTLYLSVINKESTFLLLLCAYFFYTVVDQFRGDQFYGLLTTSTIGYTILLLIIYFYIFKFKVKKDSR